MTDGSVNGVKKAGTGKPSQVEVQVANLLKLPENHTQVTWQELFMIHLFNYASFLGGKVFGLQLFCFQLCKIPNQRSTY